MWKIRGTEHQRRPLTDRDTEKQTLGCRRSDPNACRNNATPGKCAFVRADNICLLPPASWKKLFLELAVQKLPAP
jgi:hypothetical protein